MRLRGDLVRELRVRAGHTQETAAVELRCSRAAVATWETTGSLPRPARLLALASMLGVRPFELIEFNGAPTLRELRIAAGMRQLDAAGVVGVGPPTYCDVENARHRLPRRWVPVLAVAFRVPERVVRAAASRSWALRPQPGSAKRSLPGPRS